MSKMWKRLQHIRALEDSQQMRELAKLYSTGSGLETISAPSVDEVEALVKNTESLDNVLTSIKVQIVGLEEHLTEAEDKQLLAARLRVLATTIRHAIAKIETGW